MCTLVFLGGWLCYSVVSTWQSSCCCYKRSLNCQCLQKSPRQWNTDSSQCCFPPLFRGTGVEICGTREEGRRNDSFLASFRAQDCCENIKQYLRTGDYNLVKWKRMQTLETWRWQQEAALVRTHWTITFLKWREKQHLQHFVVVVRATLGRRDILLWTHTHILSGGGGITCFFFAWSRTTHAMHKETRKTQTRISFPSSFAAPRWKGRLD